MSVFLRGRPLLKLFRKITFIFLLVVVVLATAAGVSLFLFQDQFVQQFIREANKQINTPVRIGKIEVGWWRHFPHIDLVFNDVYIEDSHPGEYPLHTAEKISLSVSAIDLWNGRHLIRRLRVEGSETSLKVNAGGQSNYTVLKPGSGGDTSSISFDLTNISIADAKVTYRDLDLNQEHIFVSKGLQASVSSRNDIYFIAADGEVTTEQIRVGRYDYLTGKTFETQARLDFDDLNNHIVFHPSVLRLGQAQFEITGTYGFKERNLIDLKVDGVDTDIQSLLELLPAETAEKLSKYRSEGGVYFNAIVKGEIGPASSPGIDISFGTQEATILHPEFSSRITDARLEGHYTSSSLVSPAAGKLTLTGISGKLNSFPFEADLLIEDFDDPYVEAAFKGMLDAQSLQSFYPIESLADFEGTFSIDASLKGAIELLKNKETAQRVRTQGNIDMHNVHFNYGVRKIPIEDLNGRLSFTNNDLAMSDVSLRMGNSDFLLNGFFKNAVSYLLFEGQPIGIEADLTSRRLELDQLFDMIYGEEESDEYAFSISRNLLLNFNCKADHLSYGRFHAKSLQGEMLVKNQMAVSRNLQFVGMGGKVALSGIIDAKNSNAIDLVNTARLDGIFLDSLFYVFEDFRQTFIGYKHLKGQVFAEINLESTLNPSLRIFPETLIADASVMIRNGELLEFEPLKALKRFLDEDGLEHLRFAELKNDIHIEKKTVYIPQMEVRSNVTALTLSGTHTFDQHIDYRVVAPLRSKRLLTLDSAKNAIDGDLQGKMKVYLKITGTADDYKVAYDGAAVRKKIGGDLKKEVKELRDAFRFKGKKNQKEQELEEDDYFDWEVDPDTVKTPRLLPIRPSTSVSPRSGNRSAS